MTLNDDQYLTPSYYRDSNVFAYYITFLSLRLYYDMRYLRLAELAIIVRIKHVTIIYYIIL